MNRIKLEVTSRSALIVKDSLQSLPQSVTQDKEELITVKGLQAGKNKRGISTTISGKYGLRSGGTPLSLCYNPRFDLPCLNSEIKYDQFSNQKESG